MRNRERLNISWEILEQAKANYKGFSPRLFQAQNQFNHFLRIEKEKERFDKRA